MPSCLHFVLCVSARKPTCERDRGAEWDRGADDVGGASREAEWRTTGLHGGVQHTCQPAGQSGTHTTQQNTTQTFWTVRYWQPPSFLFLTVCGGYWIGHWAFNQSVCAPVQCVFSSVCIYRGRTRTLDHHTDSNTYYSWWVKLLKSTDKIVNNIMF